MDIVEKCLDSAWNFSHKDWYVEIENPIEPPVPDPRSTPKV